MHGKPFNAKLRNAIFVKGLTQTQLAKKSGVKRQYISLHINGHWLLTEAEKQKIAGVLRQPVSELFEQTQD